MRPAYSLPCLASVTCARCALASFAGDFWTFALLLAVAGLGDAAWHPIATGVLTRILPGRRGEALGIHAIDGSLATVLAPLVVGYLLSFMDWRDALRISVIPAVIMGVVFACAVAKHVPRATSEGLSRRDVSDFVAVQWQPAGGALLAVVIVYHMALTALMAMTPLYLQTEHGFDTASAGTAFAAALLAGALIQPLMGRLSDRVGRRRVLIAVAALGATCAMAIPFAASGAWLLLSVVGAIGVLTGVRAVVLAMAVDYAARREGTTLGFVFALMDGVGALGAVLAGTVAQLALGNAFILAGALAALCAILAMVLPLRVVNAAAPVPGTS